MLAAGLFVAHYPTLLLFHVDADDEDATAFAFADYNGGPRAARHSRASDSPLRESVGAAQLL
eukprot:SAG11_NODE_7598_length_1123_cov_3.027344_1_plen_62_part_00